MTRDIIIDIYCYIGVIVGIAGASAGWSIGKTFGVVMWCALGWMAISILGLIISRMINK